MKCSITGCSGQYESKEIVHTVHKGSDIFVFEHVPAEVWSICGDTVLVPETIRHLEVLLRGTGKPEWLAPVYEYA